MDGSGQSFFRPLRFLRRKKTGAISCRDILRFSECYIRQKFEVLGVSVLSNSMKIPIAPFLRSLSKSRKSLPSARHLSRG